MSQSVINEVRKVIIGKDEIIIKVLLSILAGGHILIEDIPGVGKTTLAVALSKALSLDYKRLQFTPDVLRCDNDIKVRHFMRDTIYSYLALLHYFKKRRLRLT